jgi:SAM-dependent methyltransferase
MEMGSLLHVGCGYDSMPEWAVGKYNEVRLDISPDTRPDIVASMVDMGEIGEFDCINCHHALEHLVPHEVPVALSEFLRVLKPRGFAVIAVPDLQDVPATEDVLFEAPCGPIAGLDLIYGYRKALPMQPYMAHRTGFIKQTLHDALMQAGFANVVVQRMPYHNLLAIAAKE